MERKRAVSIRLAVGDRLQWEFPYLGFDWYRNLILLVRIHLVPLRVQDEQVGLWLSPNFSWNTIQHDDIYVEGFAYISNA